MLSWLKNDDCVTLINASSLHTTKFNVTSRVDQIHSDGYIGITIKQLNFFWSFKIQVKSVDHVYQNEIIKTTVTRDDLVILANGAPTSSDYVKMQEK
jgi:hypothetical protein